MVRFATQNQECVIPQKHGHHVPVSKIVLGLVSVPKWLATEVKCNTANVRGSTLRSRRPWMSCCFQAHSSWLRWNVNVQSIGALSWSLTGTAAHSKALSWMVRPGGEGDPESQSFLCRGYVTAHGTLGQPHMIIDDSLFQSLKLLRPPSWQRTPSKRLNCRCFQICQLPLVRCCSV